jgi:hypothetical protein
MRLICYIFISYKYAKKLIYLPIIKGVNISCPSLDGNEGKVVSVTERTRREGDDSSLRKEKTLLASGLTQME